MRRVQLAAKSKIKHGYRLRLERDGDRVRLIACGDEVQLYAFDILALDGDDLRSLPLPMRGTNLDRLLARRPDARSALIYSAQPATWASKVRCRSAATGPIRPVGRSIGSRCYGAADGEGCGTLGALSNDTNGAPHVATF
jgi:hypothetical protein